jgi:hypothetical protein
MKSEIWGNFGFSLESIGKSCRFALILAVFGPKIGKIGLILAKNRGFCLKNSHFGLISLDFV